jgi:hypothetical protein
MQIHYNFDNLTKSPPPADATTVHLNYAEDPVDSATLTPLANRQFSIPPNATDFSAQATTDVPMNVKLWGVTPHLHQMGRRFQIELVDGGDTTCLMDIPQWDFNWQQFYFFEGGDGFPLPEGSEVRITCTWDNSTDQTVTWGEGTSDEMCISYFYWTQ